MSWYKNDINTWNIKDLEHAKSIADQITVINERPFIACDRGPDITPRYWVALVPQPGDKVSYSYNGDVYPDGVVVKITHNYRRVQTSTGNVYWRKKQTGSWIRRPWSLVPGHINKRNPDF